jgi:pimeloyl-ACP methyl ester carboxylesterase
MEKVTSQDGTAIAFDRVGSGPALILVPGAIQHRAIDPGTQRLASLLAPNFTVYQYDRRGRGDSGDTPRYAVEREIEDLAALVEQAGGSAYAFGMSSGAVLALEAARTLAFTKLALYEAPILLGADRDRLPDDYAGHLEELIASGRRGDALAYFMTEAVEAPAEVVAGMRNEPFWPALESVAHTLAYDGRVMDVTGSGNALPADRWAAVSAPVLVLDGGASPARMHNAAEALAAVLPNARRRTLDGQTHQFEPEVLAPVLEDFLTRS